MTTYVALLRAVNLPAHNKVAMHDLRSLLSKLGLRDPRTLLHSGNVVFRSDLSAPDALEHMLEEGSRKHLGLGTEFFVRNAAEWQQIIRKNPFPDAAARDPSHLVVMCLKEPPDRAAVDALREAISGCELVRAHGREAYLVYPDGIGTSRLTAAVVERKLGTRGTGRNWNTVLKLADLAAS
jgi:uncharacterized protein (DUF1697 family)